MRRPSESYPGRVASRYGRTAFEATDTHLGSLEIPPELNIGRAMCGAIVIWTRDPKRSSERD